MVAPRSRFVLLVTVLSCLAALVVALFEGQDSLAERSGSPPAAGHRFAPAQPGAGSVIDRRTTFSTVYRLPDGRRRAVVSPVPVNVKDASGRWTPIDTDLTRDGADAFTAKATKADVTLPRRLGHAAKVGDGDRWVSLTLQDAAGDAAVTGAEATYADALPGVDATYRAESDGVKETLTLADASAPATYRYAIDASAGLTPVRRGNGTVVFKDAEGTTRFWLPAPTVQPKGAPAPVTDHVGYRLSADRRTLTVAVEKRWLAKAAFPVQVDPTVYTGNQASCTLASGGLASTADCNGATLKVGHDATATYRAALRFDDLNSIVPANATISAAQIGVWFASQSTANAVTQVDAVGLSTQLGEGATWNAYDGVNPWTTPGGDFIVPPAAPAQPTPQPNPTTLYQSYTAGWVTFDVSKLAESWIRSAADDKGVVLKAHNEAAANVITLNGTGASGGFPNLSVDFEMSPGFTRDGTYETVGIDDRSGVSVNVTSGNVAVDSTDVQLPGVDGMGLTLRRTFNGEDLGDGAGIFGSGWTESINGASYLGGVTWYDSARQLYIDGHAIYRFDRNYQGDTATDLAYITPPGIDADLTVNKSTNVSTLKFRDSGEIWTYGAPSGDLIRLTTIKDRHNNTITIAPKSGNSDKVGTITDTFGKVLTFNYGTNWQLQTIGDGTRTWTYTTDTSTGHNLLTGFTNPDNKTTAYHYDTAPLPDTWDKLDQVTDARGHTIKIAYGPDGDWSQATKITRTVDGTTANDVIWQFDYTPDGAVGHACTAGDATARTVETDPRGKKTTYCYNSGGQVVQTWDALNRAASKSYTASANVKTFTGLSGTASSALTTYNFNDAGSATGTQQPAGESSTIGYCTNGTPEPSCTAGDPLSKYRPTSVTDPQDVKTTFGYNPSGDLTSVGDGYSPSRQLIMTYNADGTLATSKDANANQTTYNYDTSHHLTSVVPPAVTAPSTTLGTTSFTYDSSNRIATATDGRGKVATLTYDKEDRVTHVAYTGGFWMDYVFDANGNLTQRSDSAGNTTSYVYDNLNRRTSETFPGARTNTYGYDRSSNLLSLQDGGGTTSYTYDDINRLSSVTTPKPSSGTSTVNYTYSDASGVTGAPYQQKLTFPNGTGGAGMTETFNANTSGRLVNAIIRNSSGTVLKSVTYGYKPGAKQHTVIDTATDQGGNKTKYTYTPTVGLLSKAEMTPTGGSTPTDTWSYSYDLAGNRTLRQHVAGGTTTNTSYAYNQVNELCWSTPAATTNPCFGSGGGTPPAGSTSFAFDAVGNRTTGSLSYDAPDRLSAIGATSLGFLTAGNGELVSYGTTAFQNNMLGLGRQLPGSGSAVDYVRDPSGKALAQRTSASMQYLFQDALGSTVALADQGANALTRTYAYDPDGNATTTATGTGSGGVTDVKYAGGHQTTSGFYHFGARFYDPSTALWTQRDPVNRIASLSGASPYTYADGDPVNGVDPLGLLKFNVDLKAGPFEVGASVDDDGDVGVSYGIGSGSGASVSGSVDGGEVENSTTVEGSACVGGAVSACGGASHDLESGSSSVSPSIGIGAGTSTHYGVKRTRKL